jgi:hypothetical protein
LSFEVRYRLEYLDLEVRTILKYLKGTEYGVECIGVILLKMGTSFQLL